jgi:hypothetical protein
MRSAQDSKVALLGHLPAETVSEPIAQGVGDEAKQQLTTTVSSSSSSSFSSSSSSTAAAAAIAATSSSSGGGGSSTSSNILIRLTGIPSIPREEIPQLRALVTSETSRVVAQNNEYTTLAAEFPSYPARWSIEVVNPCAAWHVAKYSAVPDNIFRETPELYVRFLVAFFYFDVMCVFSFDRSLVLSELEKNRALAPFVPSLSCPHL